MRGFSFLIVLLLVSPALAVCGNGACVLPETPNSCPQDCFSFSVTNSTGGLAFSLGSPFIIKTDYLGNVSLQIITNSNSWEYSKTFNSLLNFSSSIADPQGNWTFILSIPGTNLSFSKSIITTLSGDNAYYGVNFNSPVEGLPYYRDDNVSISVEIFRSVQKISGATVNAFIGEKSIALSQTSPGTYSGSYNIPLSSKDSYNIIKIVAEKNTDTGPKSGGSFVKIDINPAIINVSIIKPFFTSANPGQRVDLEISAQYPDSSNVTNANVTVTTPTGVLQMPFSNGYYNLTYVIPSNFSGVWNPYFSVVDAYGNSGSNTKSILVNYRGIPVNPVYAGIAAIFLLALIVFMYFFGIRFARLRILDYYVKKQKDIKRMQDITEKKYFDRLIDEDTYMELVRKHEAELVGISTTIREMRKKLGLSKGVKKRGKK